MVEPGEPRPIIKDSYNDYIGMPIELVQSADSLPEVVQGPKRMPDLAFGPTEIYEIGVLINFASLLKPMADGQLFESMADGDGRQDAISAQGQDVSVLYDSTVFTGPPFQPPTRDAHLPEVVEGEWPQKCARRFPRDTDEPEVTRLGELMSNCMQMNYQRKAEEDGPESQIIITQHAHKTLFHNPTQGFLAKVAEFEAQGNLTEAILWQTNAVNHFRDELGFAHYSFIENVDKLAEMHWDASDKEEADDFLSKEVDIFIDNIFIRGFRDPVWTINGAYDLATVCAKYRLASLGEKLFNELIDGFEQESEQLKDGTQHTEAAREKYSDFLKNQNRWEEIVAMERNWLVRINADPDAWPHSADPDIWPDNTDALSRLAHALRQTHQTQEAEMIDAKLKAISLFGQRREPQQIEALRMLEQIRRAEIKTFGPWDAASLPTLTCLLLFYSYMNLSADAIDVAQEMVICNRKMWGERSFASISAVNVLTDRYLFDREKAAKARDLYNWLTAKDSDLVKETKPYLDLGPEDLDQRAPRSCARPDMAAGLPIAELADTSLDHGNSAPSGPAKGVPTSERRGIAAGFSKALRFWRRDKQSD